ncbi:hypothetical protein DCC26_03645 [Auritidibacter sp. NML120779]|nr:hypothetical protein DCC26_03645 [Auritidibacter sp. NML120779]
MGGPVQNRTLLATASPRTVLFHKARPMSIRPLRRPLAEENAASHADPTETATHRVARLLCQDPAQDWRLRDLADRVHLSISQLGRAFSQRFGMSPIQYLSHVRAQRLAELLVTTDLPIGVAMAQVGWHSRGHAARQFTAIVGVSPSAYRRAATQRADLTCPCCGKCRE